jgi:phosphatidylserine/phosphatidylglycerophosphate/cardiolipin synthase-like enzyme
MQRMRTFSEKRIGEVPATPAKIIPIIDGDYPGIVIPLIENCKASLDILVYEWKWYGHQALSSIQQFNLAICSAARRGVHVRALLNIEHSTHPISRINTRTERFLRQAGCEVRMANVGGRTHAKMLIIDKNILVLGSHNFCKSSFSTNAEVSIVVAECPQIEEYQHYFDELWTSKW